MNKVVPVEFKEKNPISKKLWPLTLLLGVLALDVLTKCLIVHFIPQNTVGFNVIGDFFRIIHVRNPGIAFSIGYSLSDTLRSILFAVVPFLVIILVMVVYFRNNDFTQLQRWAICGIVGGGLGNLIDRFFRPDGVVDFLDFKFYGLFGFERWPTFNVADSAVLICAGILMVSFVLEIIKEKKTNKDEG
ncbi:MAG: signal peptidase II [Spirochaetaceae bacterium]|nr:signal peptidase II [Spirochaetaceae bacterium]